MPSMDAAPLRSASVVETEAVTSASSRRLGPDDDRRIGPAQKGHPPPPDRDAGVGPDDPEGPPFSPTTMVLLVSATVAVLVGIAGAPVLDAIRPLAGRGAHRQHRPAAPPRDPFVPETRRRPAALLLLLHFWMGVFGTSDDAVRSLSGVFGVVTLPLAWLAGKRLGGRRLAWAALLLVATSPFAVRYDTETRMYSLVALLTVLGFLALDRSLRSPRPGNLIAVAVVTGLLLYTHYWSLYLVGTVMLVAGLGGLAGPAGVAARGPGLAGGGGGRLPDLPPVAARSSSSSPATPGRPGPRPANFAAMVSAVSSFAGGGHQPGAGPGPHVLRPGRPRACSVWPPAAATSTSTSGPGPPRPSAGRRACVGTLAAAIAGGFLTKSAFDARYASVVFIPLHPAGGARGDLSSGPPDPASASSPWRSQLGLAGAIPNVTTNRTQAGQVAAAIASHRPPRGRRRLLPGPTRALPSTVCCRRVATGRPPSPGAPARRSSTGWTTRSGEGGLGRSLHPAGPVDGAEWQADLPGLGARATRPSASSARTSSRPSRRTPPTRSTRWWQGDPTDFYQPMWLVRFIPTKS